MELSINNQGFSGRKRGLKARLRRFLAGKRPLEADFGAFWRVAEIGEIKATSDCIAIGCFASGGRNPVGREVDPEIRGQSPHQIFNTPHSIPP